MTASLVTTGKLRAALLGVLLASASLLHTRPIVAQDAMKEFQTRVQEYVALHKKANASIPSAPKNVNDPTIIAQHEQQLAQAIRTLRSGAKRGDIFTPAAQKAIAAIIKTKLDSNAKAAILGDGNPKS